MTFLAPRRQRLVALVVVVGVELVALTYLAIDVNFTVSALLVAYAIAFAAYLAALLIIRRTPPPLWLGVGLALLLRLPWIPTTPRLSDDVWRYLHDGRAQLAGVSPYRFPPAAPEAAEFGGPERRLINHPELLTVYPPAAQLTFLVAAVLGANLMAWKVVVLVFELVLAAGIVNVLRTRGVQPGAVAAYLLHPLPVIEFAGNAHMDAVAIAALILTLAFALEGRRVAAGAALAFTIASKYLAAPLLAFGARALREARARFVIACAGTAILLYLPYRNASPLGSLGTFARTFEFNGSIYEIATAVMPPLVARGMLAAALVMILVVLWRTGAGVERAAFVWVAAALLASPIVHPWYVTWLIPFLAWRRAPWALVWSGTVVLAYTVLPRWHEEGIWELPRWVPWVEYVPVFALIAWAARGERRSQPDDGGVASG